MGRGASILKSILLPPSPLLVLVYILIVATHKKVDLA